jgi:hypothetical protein
MNISQSKWVSNLIRGKLQCKWPEQVAALAGAWKDFLPLEEIREEAAPDAERESMWCMSWIQTH